MKKALLASTALVGAALLTAPAQAGTVGSGDNMAVKLSGVVWIQANTVDMDDSDGHGRGYVFRIPDTELHINASNTADNGLKYGVSIELETNTNAGNNGDEVWAHVSGDFGRIEMGDQDDVTNRMMIGSQQTNKGGAGSAGGLTSLNSVFYGSLNENFLQRGDWQPFTTGDHTKIIYFTPRFSGLQAGISYTPDAGQDGAEFSERDDNGSYEDILSMAVNYVGKFDDVTVSAAVGYETGEGDDGGASKEDLQIFGVGARVDVAGFRVGANYHNANDTNLTTTETAAGEDSGSYWAVGVGYGQGPWGVSAWYSDGERDASSTVEIGVTRWGIGAGYAVAPGWKITADYLDNEMENKDGTAGNNEDSRAFSLTSWFSF